MECTTAGDAECERVAAAFQDESSDGQQFSLSCLSLGRLESRWDDLDPLESASVPAMC